MQKRIDINNLLSILSVWNSHLKKKVHLIACGGTALTLMNLKESTKDMDLIVPEEKEYIYLIKILKDLGYKEITGTGWAKDEGFVFDLFAGKTIFTTTLLESPLKEGNHILFKEYSYLYVGILNYYDMIISKIFRSYPVDIDDGLTLFREKYKEINIEKLKSRFFETSSYDVSDEKNKRNFAHFLNLLEKRGFKI